MTRPVSDRDAWRWSPTTVALLRFRAVWRLFKRELRQELTPPRRRNHG